MRGGQSPPWFFQPLLRALGPGRREEPRPTAASRRTPLPPSGAAGVVQVLRPYRVSGADGRWRDSGAGNVEADGGGTILPPGSFSLFSSLWGPGDERSSGRRPQAGGPHFRRQAQRASCKSCVRTACPELTGGGGTRAREMSRQTGGQFPPAPPGHASRLRRFGRTRRPGARSEGKEGRPEDRPSTLLPDILLPQRAVSQCRGRRFGCSSMIAHHRLERCFVCRGQPFFNERGTSPDS